jgi:hypothetical protein
MVSKRGSPTIADAAARFGVSVKTVRNWIESGKVPMPPSEPNGSGSVLIFPEPYMQAAIAALTQYQEELARLRQERLNRKRRVRN